MTSAFPSQRLKIRFLPAVPGTDAKGSAIAAKFWFDQAKIQADIALQANETKVDKAGSTMTGPLILSGDPTSDPQAATKHYADTKVAKAGDSMSGFLTLNADPTATLHAATKHYADTKVPLAGGTMTGVLTLNANPIGALDAATKQYADGTVSTIGGALFQPKDPDLTSIAANTTNGTWLFRRANGDWAPVVIGDGLSFDTVNGQFESVGGGGGGTGDVSASDGPVANQLAMWIGSVTIKGINIGTGLQLTTVGATQSLTAIGSVKINGTPTPGQFATWFDSSTIQGANLDGDLTALAALTGVNTIYYRSGTDTWSPVNVSSGLAFSGGNLTATGSIAITPTPAVGQTAQWSGAASLKGVQVHTASPTAPVAPVPGNFWFDTSTGVLAVNVDDGNSQQWIQIAPPVTGNNTSSEAFVKVRTFTATNVYVPTPGTQFAIVECVGGGAGGGATAGTANDYFTGGGGGSGGYSRSVLTAAQIGTSQSITVGTAGNGQAGTAGLSGGPTAFGGLVIANGGIGGELSYVGLTAAGMGGAGGTAGTGDVAAAGAPGGNGIWSNVASAFTGGGEGGSSIFGGGARPAPYPGSLNANGLNASNYGSGGSGAGSFNSAGTAIGGNGSPGLCVVTEYNIGVGQQGPQGLAGGVTTPLTPQGRLTLLTGEPVMVASQPNKTTLFYSPYVGNQIPIFNGASWATMSFNELSAVTTDATKSPNAIGASKINDWFVWNDAGTLRLSHGFDWPNDTGRFGPSGLGRVNGIWMNAAAITNGPGAARGTYVGTTRSNTSSQLDWILGSSVSGGGAALLNVWNCYNRVDAVTKVLDAAGSWSIGGSAWQMMDVGGPGGGAGNRVSFVVGLAEDCVEVSLNARTQTGSPGNTLQIGVILDGTTNPLAATGSQATLYNSTGVVISQMLARYSGALLGYHFVQAMQWSDSGTIYGDTYTTLLGRIRG